MKLKSLTLTFTLIIGFFVISVAQTNDPIRRGSFDVNDPGSFEGLRFLGTSANWSIDVSPTNRSNSDGNLNLYGTTNKIVAWQPLQVEMLQFQGYAANSNVAHNRYGIYQEPGNWSHPYPDLVINYHTGIKYAGYKGYGGHRFYVGANANPNELAFSVGEGDENTRVEYSLLVNQKVGIGIDQPSRPFHIRSDDAILQIDRGGSTPGIGMTAYNSDYSQVQKSFTMYVTSEGPDNGFFTIADWHQDVSGASEPRFTIDNTGNVGIGTAIPSSKLAVIGLITTKEIKVQNVTGADFVFADSYQLPPLREVADHIQQHQHLPEVPSATKMQKEGVKLGEMNMLLLQKIEELTLYLIDQEKRLLQVEQTNQELQEQLRTLTTTR